METQTQQRQNDLVFRNNGQKLEFVGDFERLYQTDPDPWYQSGGTGKMSDYYLHSRSRLVAALRNHIKPDTWGLELGCGHGHVTALLSELFKGIRWVGWDISLTAIDQARVRYPRLNCPRCDFYVCDITKNLIHYNVPLPRYHTVIMGQMLWYTLHRIHQVLDNCYELLCDDGIFVITQGFLDNQSYGTNVVDGFDGLVKLMSSCYPDRFGLIEARYDDSKKYVLNDGVLVYRKKPT